ncbi:TonB-dependent receptor [Pseudomonas sp. TMP25]|uniref:TonB-dependent receptor domain-containing protein n=1 Tax=Pseudomonas sp. TMP25 TaxID=3136561 RepID=UPI003101443E
MKLSRLALAVALLSPGYSFAETPSHDEALKLPDSLITANRAVQKRNESSSASTVFTRADIERLQPRSVADLLRRVPGMQIGQSGGRGSLTGIYLRGTKSAQTLMLIDGQRFNSADSGTAALETLSVEQIERIEVLRGSRSAMYGADAIGGVIQVFTRRASGEGLKPRLHLGYGSRNSWERSAGLSGGDDNTRFNLSVASEDTDGIDRTNSDNGPDQDNDAYRNNSVSFNLGHSFNERLELGINVLDLRGESEYDQGWLGDKPYDEFKISNVSTFVDGKVNDIWQSRLEVGHSENRRFNRADDSDSSSAFSTYRNSAASINTLHLSDSQSLILGADWYEDQLNNDNNFAESTRWNQAALAQHRFQGEHFSTELGMRHDKNEQYGSQNTWNGALSLPVNAANELILSYSEGFRAPTFADLYFPGYDNPNLKPEHSKSYELQWRSQLAEDTRLEASVYRTDIRDAIVSDSSFTQQNIATARIHGFEAELQQAVLGWQTVLGVSVIDPRDRDTSKTLARRAKRTLNLDVDRQFNRLTIGATWQALSRAYSDAANTQEVAGYGLLNLRSSWQANPEIKLGLTVDNALNKTYSSALYSVFDFSTFQSSYFPYQEEGRSARLSVTWTPDL